MQLPMILHFLRINIQIYALDPRPKYLHSVSLVNIIKTERFIG